MRNTLANLPAKMLKSKDRNGQMEFYSLRIARKEAAMDSRQR